MSTDPRSTARSAREGFAQGLQLLQSPGLPQPYLDAAEPIARTMGLLHQIEHGQAASAAALADQALATARESLAKLQSLPTPPNTANIAERAMAIVAHSLSLVHRLKTETAVAPTASVPQPPNAPPVSPEYPPLQLQPAFPAYQNARQPAQPIAAPALAAQVGSPQLVQAAQSPRHVVPPPQANQPQAGGSPAVASQPSIPQPPLAPSFAPNRHGSVPHQSASMPATETPSESILPTGMVEAELGAHSSSNFYKTLNGNDIVDHGGIFVATYSVPRLGSRVLLRVHLPGGYKFDCDAIVRWTREARDNPDAPPGFGAQFRGITPEQRQLIQRYVRNREPLFYDDF